MGDPEIIKPEGGSNMMQCQSFQKHRHMSTTHACVQIYIHVPVDRPQAKERHNKGCNLSYMYMQLYKGETSIHVYSVHMSV